jgi:hypothetical protein
MSKTITVEKGDCFINITKQEGFFWETIWNHPENKELPSTTQAPQYHQAGRPDLFTRSDNQRGLEGD